MSSTSLVIIIGSYFALLFVISLLTGKNSSNDTFYRGNRNSQWYVVAFGMLGASLSGVTFISVPGWVQTTGFTYMQMVMGYFFGYLVIAQILLPVYYKLKLTSIYEYLETRFGKNTYKAGASFFLLSRLIGASFRLFLMASVLQLTIFSHYNIPFYLTVIVTISLIWLYTFRGGIKTIIWTDTIQTFLLLAALVLTITELISQLNMPLSEIFTSLKEDTSTRMFVFDDWVSKQNFFKQFLSGVFITIVMTGLDQDMMQKNLTCRNLNDAQKNVRWYGFAFIPVNFLFLSLGALLLLYASKQGIALPEKTDDIYPMIATGGFLSPYIAVIFMLGLIAAAYSSADSALTSLTTSFTVDILPTKKMDERKSRRIRLLVHLGVSVVIVCIILAFHLINKTNVISAIFKAAGYTYGPLLGVYAFGLFTKRKANDRLIPFVMLSTPFISAAIDLFSPILFNFHFGFELLIINGALTFLGVCLCSQKQKKSVNTKTDPL